MSTAPARLGILFFLVAPAGAGKNALMNRVIERVSGLTQLATATTRAMRPGEVEGREHLFVTKDRFLHMIDHDELLEWQEIHGQEKFYGVPRAVVEEALDSGRDLIADIEYKGATTIKAIYPENTILIFIQPPSVATLIERMRDRSTKEEEIARRLLRVPAELAAANTCDYLIVNDELEAAVDVLYSIVIAERSRRAARMLRLQGGLPENLYTIHVAAVATHNNAVLCRQNAPRFPVVPVHPEEQAHEAVMRALRDEFGVQASTDQFLSQAQIPGDPLPPTTVASMNGSGAERVIMYYIYQLPERIQPPATWVWTPADQTGLPPRVLQALQKLAAG